MQHLTPDDCAVIRDRVAAFCCPDTHQRMRNATNTAQAQQLIEDFNTLINEIARLHDLLAVPAQLVMEV